MTNYEWTDGSGHLLLRLTQDDVDTGYHQGACDDDVAGLRTDPRIESQLQALNPQHVREYLREFGAWDDDELSNWESSLDRVLWLACGDCRDEPDIYKVE